jgi:hypothetical protein
MSTVLVAGSSRPSDRLARRSARMVASTLIEHGFNLLTGSATGVDKSVAKSFCSELRRRGEPLHGRFEQLTLPWHLRGSFWPIPGFNPDRADKSTETAGAPPSSSLRVRIRRRGDWLEEARSRADAAVMIGGHAGTQRIADRFMDAGKPVFPVPFTGGCSNDVFREVLRNWGDHPVPGLTKSQFLRLAVPWVAGTGALADLLLGTLSPTPDIFISYRRADSEWISGRLRQDLAEHFGTKRVFMDLEHIRPSQSWGDVIDAAIKACRVGIVVIGNRWFEHGSPDGPRVFDPKDVLRKEVLGLLSDPRRIVIVVLTGDVSATQLRDLPEGFERLSMIQAVTITPATWDVVLEQIVRTIRPALRAPRLEQQAPPANAQGSLPQVLAGV